VRDDLLSDRQTARDNPNSKSKSQQLPVIHDDPLLHCFSQLHRKKPTYIPGNQKKPRRNSAPAICDKKFQTNFCIQQERRALVYNTHMLFAQLGEKNSQIELLRKNGGGSEGDSLSYPDLLAKLAEIQKKLMGDQLDPRDQETLNVDYEKLTNQLEKRPEYHQEQEASEIKWRAENNATNRVALKKLWDELKQLPDEERTKRLKKDPVLHLLTLSKDRILKKHEGDWAALTPHTLTLIEARAIYAVLPVFKREQQRQQQFVEGLKTKIEELKKKETTPVEKPIKASRKVTFKRPEGGTPGAFLEELMQRRRKN